MFSVFCIFVNLFLSLGIYFDCLLSRPERALEAGRWLKEAHFGRAQGSDFIQGVFLTLRKFFFLKFFQFVLLCHVAMSQRRDVDCIKKNRPLSRHDVGSQRLDIDYPSFGPPCQRRDVSLHHFLECRDVGFQRRDVGFVESLACRDVGS